MKRAVLAVVFLVLGCATEAKQLDSRDVKPAQPGGRVVLLRDVVGKYPDVTAARLYFYPGKFEIVLKAGKEGVWRGDLSPEEVTGMARQLYGFRVYRCRLTVETRNASGESDSQNEDLTVALEP